MTSTAAKARKFPEIDVNDPAYQPGPLLDAITKALKLKNDAALSRELGVAPPVVSKIRNARVALSAQMIIRIHDVTAWSIAQIRSYVIGQAM